jgi:hypothetical protein
MSQPEKLADDLKTESNLPALIPNTEKKQKSPEKKENHSFLEEMENGHRKRTFTVVQKQECWNRVLI